MVDERYTVTRVVMRSIPALVIGLACGAVAGIWGGRNEVVNGVLTGAVCTAAGLVVFGPWSLPFILRAPLQHPGTVSVHCGVMTSPAVDWAFASDDPTNACERLILVFLGFHTRPEGTTGTLYRTVVDLQELAQWARLDLAEVTRSLDALLTSGLVTVAKPRDTDRAPAFYLTRVPTPDPGGEAGHPHPVA